MNIPQKEEIKKILCIKPRGIGDIVLSTIILDNLKAYYPDVKIDYLTEGFAKPALLHNPLVNKVIIMDKTEFPLKAAWKIRKEKYDMILDLWSNPRSAQITFLSGVKYRTGFAYRGRKFAYNILATGLRGEHHSAEHNLEILKPLNIPVISRQIHFYVSQEDDLYGKDFVNNNFNKEDIVIGIVPAGGWASKRCDAVKWIEICSSLNNELKIRFLILWGPGDEEDANIIYKSLPDITVLAPKTTLSGMTGLIKNCDMIIANDSGPMHISAALGIPTLGIFGPTDPKSHGPYSPNSAYVIKEDLFCIICNKLVCPYNHECMMQLPVRKVIERVEFLLKKV